MATAPQKEKDSAALQELADHEALTKGIHGIADVSKLATKDEIKKGEGGGGLPEVEEWHVVGDAEEPAFGPGWSNFSESGFDPIPLRFRKDELGDVVIEGFVAGSGAGSTVFQLPVGFRPKGGLLCFAQVSSSQAFRLDITEDGIVRSSSATVIFMTLIARFRAE
jgi:hypothetical protein